VQHYIETLTGIKVSKGFLCVQLVLQQVAGTSSTSCVLP
jgi:hypothetical protein